VDLEVHEVPAGHDHGIRAGLLVQGYPVTLGCCGLVSPENLDGRDARQQGCPWALEDRADRVSSGHARLF